tara:strand:+ start:888 stop:1118 length:231 start_codon:yes stop_codon:yes gene_type:complete
MPKYRIVVDFDGLRDDGEYIDGRAVEAKDGDEALHKLQKDFKQEMDILQNWSIRPIKPGTEDEVDWDSEEDIDHDQ